MSQKGPRFEAEPRENEYSKVTLGLLLSGESWAECADLLREELDRVEAQAEKEDS